MFKPAVTDPEEIKAILQKTLTAKAEGNTSTATSSAAASKKEEGEESSKDDKAKWVIIQSLVFRFLTLKISDPDPSIIKQK
jgi:hypothetical protein